MGLNTPFILLYLGGLVGMVPFYRLVTLGVCWILIGVQQITPKLSNLEQSTFIIYHPLYYFLWNTG